MQTKPKSINDRERHKGVTSQVILSTMRAYKPDKLYPHQSTQKATMLKLHYAQQRSLIITKAQKHS